MRTAQCFVLKENVLAAPSLPNKVYKFICYRNNLGFVRKYICNQSKTSLNTSKLKIVQYNYFVRILSKNGRVRKYYSGFDLS